MRNAASALLIVAYAFAAAFAAAFAWLDDPAACARLAARFDALHAELRCDTARIATDAIEDVLSRRQA